MCSHTSGRLQSLSCQTPETQSSLSPRVTKEAARMNHSAMAEAGCNPVFSHLRGPSWLGLPSRGRSVGTLSEGKGA